MVLYSAGVAEGAFNVLLSHLHEVRYTEDSQGYGCSKREHSAPRRPPGEPLDSADGEVAWKTICGPFCTFGD